MRNFLLLASLFVFTSLQARKAICSAILERIDYMKLPGYRRWNVMGVGFSKKTKVDAVVKYAKAIEEALKESRILAEPGKVDITIYERGPQVEKPEENAGVFLINDFAPRAGTKDLPDKATRSKELGAIWYDANTIAQLTELQARGYRIVLDASLEFSRIPDLARYEVESKTVRLAPNASPENIARAIKRLEFDEHILARMEEEGYYAIVEELKFGGGRDESDEDVQLALQRSFLTFIQKTIVDAQERSELLNYFARVLVQAQLNPSRVLHLIEIDATLPFRRGKSQFLTLSAMALRRERAWEVLASASRTDKNYGDLRKDYSRLTSIYLGARTLQAAGLGIVLALGRHYYLVHLDREKKKLEIWGTSEDLPDADE